MTTYAYNEGMPDALLAPAASPADLEDVVLVPLELRRYVHVSAWAIDSAVESFALSCSSCGHAEAVDDPTDLGEVSCPGLHEDERTGREYRCNALYDALVVVEPTLGATWPTVIRGEQ